jgi:hypothetical protein
MKTNQLRCTTRCPLSPMLFNIYINAILRCWCLTIHGNITLKNNNTQDTLIHAHDQALFTNNDDEFVYWVHRLKIIANNFNTEISATKTKSMACRGKTLVRNKISVRNSTLEQVNVFNTWATAYLTQKRVMCR